MPRNSVWIDLLRGTEIWRPDHACLHCHMLSLWRALSQLYTRVRDEYPNQVRRSLVLGCLGTTNSHSIRGENQFKNWFIYFLLAFVISTLLAEIFFLNKALALFNTAMVTPTYYVRIRFYSWVICTKEVQVIFTFCVIVTSAVRILYSWKAAA